MDPNQLIQLASFVSVQNKTVNFCWNFQGRHKHWFGAQMLLNMTIDVASFPSYEWYGMVMFNIYVELPDRKSNVTNV